MSAPEAAIGGEGASLRRAALAFVLLIGVVSLFADMTYEGARSILGPYMLTLGASATVVGIVSGFGELVGYGLRLFSGRISDKTRHYWTVALVGYFIQMIAVPCLALAGSWQVAAVLWIAERTGKATRNPPRDAILAHASTQIGRGWAFGLHEALDQTGATIGPLVLALVLFLQGSYKPALAILAVPAVLCLTLLLSARAKYPNPSDFEAELPAFETRLPRLFWLYLLGVGLMAAAFTDFPLIAFHFKDAKVISDSWTPVFYAAGMAMGAVSALVMGRLYDRVGVWVVIGAFSLTAFFPILVFYGGAALALLGVILWGIGLGSQESVMKSVLVHMVPRNRRASAYGMFDSGFGVFWFVGSAILGILYDQSIAALVAFSMTLQVLAVAWILALRRRLTASAVADTSNHG